MYPKKARFWSPTKETVSNFDFLPAKIISRILLNLGMWDIFQFGQVCSRFRAIAMGHIPYSTLEVNLTYQPRGMFLELEELTNMLEFWRDGITHLSLNTVLTPGENRILEIVFNGCIFNTKLHSKDSTFYKLLRSLTSLMELNIKGTQSNMFCDHRALEKFVGQNLKLNKVTMSCVNSNYVFEYLNTLPEYMQYLQIRESDSNCVRLKASNGTKQKVLHLVDMDAADIIAHFFACARHLKTFRTLMFFDIDKIMSPLEAVKSICQLVNLKELHIGLHGLLISDLDVELIVLSCTKIRKLMIYADGTNSLGTDSIVSIFKHLPDLHSLGIMGWNITEMMPSDAALQAQNLRYLRIHHCGNLLLASLIDTLIRAPKLEILDILYCNFTPEDVQFILNIMKVLIN